MTSSFGWTGKILWVDLTNRNIKTVPTSDFDIQRFLGGVGLNTKIFWEMGCPAVQAFHPDNPLLISVGPLTGVSGPFNRAEICGIAPQSFPKELFAYSGLGGKFPIELKYAGYDGIVILGKADKPVYLAILDGVVTLEDARRVWGLDTFETQKTLLSKHPAASVLAIGPAGENLSRIAIVLNETASAAGQGGYGGVMGSKNLKAIVAKGTGTVKIAKPDDLMSLIQARKDAGEWLRGGAQSWGRYALCGEPVRSNMQSKYLKRIAGCHGCTYQCMGFYDMPGVGKGGQMCVEAWYGWFSKGSSEGYWEGNILSQKLGINNYELLGIMSFIASAFAAGAVDKKDLGVTSIPMFDNSALPEYGGQKTHHQFLTELLNGIAEGKTVLAQGLGRAAAALGPTAVAIYKNLYPAHGYTRHHIECVGAALHWATDTRDPYSSCHDYSFVFGPSASMAAHFGVPGGDISASGGTYRGTKNVYEKTELQTAWVQNNQCMKNSLPMCEYASTPNVFYHPPQMDISIFQSKILSAVTGIEASVDSLKEAAESIMSLRRAVMVLREDRRREDDTLGDFWFERVGGGAESLSGPLDRTQWEALKNRYYALRGWEIKNGWPTRATLEKLGMKAVADKLEASGKLG